MRSIKKRRLQRKTNYLRRRRILETGKDRIVVRKSNKYIIVQYVKSEVAQDKVIYSFNSRELIKQGWPENKKGSLKSIPAAYLSGFIFGKKIKKEKEKSTLDMGLIRSTKGSKVYAVLKGIVDAGAKVYYNDVNFPSDERIFKPEFKEIINKIKSKSEDK